MPDLDPEQPTRPTLPSNPYAPPEAELSTPPRFEPTESTGRPFSADEVLARSWEIFKAQMGTVFGVVIVPLLIDLLYQFAGQRMAETVDQQSAMGRLAEVMFTLSGVLIRIWLACGSTMALIKIARGDEAQVSDVFHGGPYVLRTIGASLLYGLGLFPVFALMFAPAGLLYLAGNLTAALVAAVVGFLASMAAALLTAARFYQYTYLIIDQDAGVVESLRRSFQITRGHTLTLVGLFLIAMVVGVGGVLLCFVGYFFTMSWSLLLLACVYVALIRERPAMPSSLVELDTEP